MTISERAEAGAALKATGACNCAQAVLRAFEDKVGADARTMAMTAGFAAGMGGMEGTCGAVVGAVVVAGILSDGKGTPRLAREIVEKFRGTSGATICRELKAGADGRPLCECPQCVRNAILALGELPLGL